VGTYYYVAVCRRGRLGGARRWRPQREERGGAYFGGRPPVRKCIVICCKYPGSQKQYPAAPVINPTVFDVFACTELTTNVEMWQMQS